MNTAATDTTRPTTPQVTDEGTSTTRRDRLSASWISQDPESGIAEYQYAIGTFTKPTKVVGWTSVGTATSVTKTGLTLRRGRRYYFSVRAKNGAGLWSRTGRSDGIRVRLR